MKPYTVTWLRDVSDDLAEIWLAAADRTRVSSAANEIDRILRTDADLQGRQISEGLRAIDLPPLRVMFEVNADDCQVEVVWIRRI